MKSILLNYRIISSLPEDYIDVVSYKVESFGAAVERFRNDQIYITAEFLTETKLISNTGSKTNKEIVEEYNRMISNGEAEDFDVLLLI